MDVWRPRPVGQAGHAVHRRDRRYDVGGGEISLACVMYFGTKGSGEEVG